MSDFLSDLRYATRRLAAAPGFTCIATLTLALGIGMTSAIYAVVDAIMLRPLPYADPDRLVEFRPGSGPDGRGGIRPVSNRSMPVDQFLEWRAQTDVFEVAEPYEVRSPLVTGDGNPQTAIAAALGGRLMELLGVAPARGRLLAEADAQPGHDQVVVLSDAFWRGRFNADPAIVGRSIRLDDKPYEIVGVMPPSFRFPYGQRQLWMPLVVQTTPGRPGRGLSVLARVRRDLTVAQAQTRVDAIASRLDQEKPAKAGWALGLGPLIARHVNAPVRTALYVLAGAVSLVLLIACANLANLLLVQGATREREVAVRAALGASRGRLVRQFLTETLLLGAAGAAAGVLMARWAIGLLEAYTPSAMTFLTVNAIALDGRVVFFAVGLAVATVLLFGTLPALKGSRAVPHDALKTATRSATATPGQEHLRRAFVVVQLAVSVMLLVGAGLLMRTFTHLHSVDTGFDTRALASARLSFPRWKYTNAAARAELVQAVMARLRGIPGVQAVTLTQGLPPDATNIAFSLKFDVEGRGVVLDDPKLVVPFMSVAPDYFTVMGIPIKAGRSFSADDRANAPKVVVISEAMARSLWNGDNPVGQRFRLDVGTEDPWYTVVGVAGNVFQFAPARPRDQLAYYFPLAQTNDNGNVVVVRAAGDPGMLIPAVTAGIRSIDPDQPLADLATMTARYAEFFDVPRFYAWLFGAFAVVGVLIAAVGLYGVLAYAIAQRTREFGIRIALGARPADVLGIVLRSGGLVTVLGLALGAGGSLIVTRAMDSMLVEISRIDPVTYGVVAGALAATAAAACWIPARRATRVDPVVALRSE
jgi:putative ABC transport system permease protein